MSKYYSKNQKTRREKIGFYTAFAICLIAVCMAVYSTYTTVRSPESARSRYRIFRYSSLLESRMI